MANTSKDRHLSEKVLKNIFKIAASVSILAIFAILVFLLYFASPVFSLKGLQEVFSWHWQPFQGEYGILPVIVGSICLSVLATVIAFPIGISVSAFIYNLAPGLLARIVNAVIHFMTSIPTIVYAFVSAMVLPSLIRDFFKYGSGFSLLAATIMLVILILPTIVLLINATWIGYRKSISLTCAALGIIPEQEVFGVVLPISRKNLKIAFVLGFARAAGDTMIALMLTGNAPQVPHTVLDSIRALTAHIALVVAVDSTSAAYHSVFACGLILLLTTALMSIGVGYLNQRQDKGVDIA
ncbi:ABC transporter permease subunit [bacterium]|nr:ABC transporter permease subunit [bacterium]